MGVGVRAGSLCLRRLLAICVVACMFSVAVSAPSDAAETAETPPAGSTHEKAAADLNRLFTEIYVNSGSLNAIFEGCVGKGDAAGEFFDTFHTRYVRNDALLSGLILAVQNKVIERHYGQASISRRVEDLAKRYRSAAYSELKRMFVVSDEGQRSRLCDGFMAQVREGEWSSDRLVDAYFDTLAVFDGRLFEEFSRSRTAIELKMKSGG
jgi:hypothetical protein